MKKIILILVALAFTNITFAASSVSSPRNTATEEMYLLPSWIDLNKIYDTGSFQDSWHPRLFIKLLLEV